MPLWTSNNSGGNRYNQNQSQPQQPSRNNYGSYGADFHGSNNMSYNSGYGRQEPGFNPQQGTGFGFGRQNNVRRSLPSEYQNNTDSRQNSNRNNSPYSLFGNTGMQQQYQQHQQQPLRGNNMPSPMQNIYSPQQQMPPQAQQQYQQPIQGINIPPQMPYGFESGQPQQQPAFNINNPPAMQSSLTGQQQYQPPHINNTSPSDQFESINKNLPDGVRYQPIDINNLPKPGFGAGASKTPSTTPIAAIPPLPSVQAPVSDNNQYAYMEKFIQNERNGESYYRHLADISPTLEFRNIISNIGSGCGKRKEAFSAIYAGKGSKLFFPLDVEINNRVSFTDGISLAIKEESKALYELSDIYENAEDEKIIRFLNSQMYKKITDLSYLHLINSKIS